MAYEPKQIANFFIGKGLEVNNVVTPMKAIKLTYIAHGWYLAIYDQPLICESIHAWKYGPVIHSLYYALKKYGNQSITEPIQSVTLQGRKISFITDAIPMEDQSTLDFLGRVWDVYGGYTGLQLSNMTHADGTPWKKTVEPMLSRGTLPMGLSILDDVIKQHFKEKISE